MADGCERNRFEELKALLSSLPDCATVARLDCRLSGFPSFFPGGPGFCGSEVPVGGVMFIGNNFGTIEQYEALPSTVCEFEPDITNRTRNQTWWCLWNLVLRECGIPIERCFFTNAYLGAIVTDPERAAKGKKTKNVGALNAERDYRNACVDALAEQVRIAEPRLVILLGGHAPKVFAQAFPQFGPFARGGVAAMQERQPVGGHALALTTELHAHVLVLQHPSNPRSDESKREQGRLLKAAYVAAAL